MALPLRPPVLPQLAKSQKSLPEGDGWVYEPKWDGFRSIAFVDGGEVHLQSRNGKPLTRYFPELKFPEGRYVLDGEIVLFDDAGPPGLRRARPAHPPGEVAHRHARRADADALHRLRPARGRRRDAARAAPARAPRPPRAADRGARRPHARLRGPRRRAAVAAGRRGRDRQAPGSALPARRARRDGEDQARAHDRRRRARLAARARRRARSARSPSGSTTPRATCARSATARASPPSRSASCRPSSPPTRPASASAPSRAAGTPRATWTAPSSGPSWSSK